MTGHKSWSLIDPKPVLVYVKDCDDHIVYWNGIVMPHSMALAMALETIGIYASPEMRRQMELNYETLYYAGAFGTRAWDDRVSSGWLYPYLARIMRPHITKLTEARPAAEILAWFDPAKSHCTQSEETQL